MKNMILGLIFLGVVMVLAGLYYALFTNVATTKGVDGIFLIAGLIAGGLFVSIPAKIYLTLQAIKLKGELTKDS